MTEYKFHPNAAEYLRMAVTSAEYSATHGGGPFGAVLVNHNDPSKVIYTDTNHVTEHNDPTAHAEVSVIRVTCAAEETFSLEGWTLYSSCEPCPMCLASSLWAHVDAVVYAADRYDAAEAGFDDLAFYERLNSTNGGLTFQFEIKEKLHPFEAWKANEGKIDY